MDKKLIPNSIKAATRKFSRTRRRQNGDRSEAGGHIADQAVDRPGFDIAVPRAIRLRALAWIGNECRRSRSDRSCRDVMQRHGFDSALERPDTPGADCQTRAKYPDQNQ